MKDYHQHNSKRIKGNLWVHKLENLREIDKFIDTKLTQEVIKKSPQTWIQAKTIFKQQILHKLFQNLRG